jgi:hypothetical protein
VPAGRTEVAAERFDGWLRHRLLEHPEATVEVHDGVTTVRWDGGGARCEGFRHDPLGVVLIRRGGYAVGLARQGTLVESKAGRRHVQGRTAAGGWSQQRFARRRENQAGALVEAVAGHVERLLVTGVGGIPAGLVLGGDRALVAAVLAESQCRPLRDLPRRELPDLPDPDAKVLADAVRRGRSVWIFPLASPS